MNTAYIYHPIYLEHDQPSHPENARRLKRILSTLEEEKVLTQLKLLEPRPATDEELERVHTPEHIERVKRMAQGGGGNLDPDTYVSPRSFDAASMAAGGVVRATEAVLAGEIANGFALVRPPGHHATSTRAMGFCLFNNVAVAARAALANESVERVFIADFDVHHGNGTQDTFADDPAVFYFSTHQYPYYPGTGSWNEMGHGAGRGTLLNVPLPVLVGASLAAGGTLPTRSDPGLGRLRCSLERSTGVHEPLFDRLCPAGTRTGAHGKAVMRGADRVHSRRRLSIGRVGARRTQCFLRHAGRGYDCRPVRTLSPPRTTRGRPDRTPEERARPGLTFRARCCII
jgi:hypothetical protein